MSGINVLNQNIPSPSTPVFDIDTGIMSLVWYQFFLALFVRTGGTAPAGSGVPGGLNGNVQFNDGGAFGGLTNTQLTARINVFTSVLSGAVPASGGGTSTFLRADGTFATSSATGGAGGDLSGSYPNPTVVAINGAALGTTTATAGNVLIGDGSKWVTNPVAGDASITSSGTVTVSRVNAVAYPAAPSKNTVPVVTASNTITYETVPVLAGGTGVTTSTGTAGDTVLSKNPTLTGATVDGNGGLALTTQTSGAGVALGTLTNAPSVGDPTFWLQVQINGAPRYVPAWT